MRETAAAVGRTVTATQYATQYAGRTKNVWTVGRIASDPLTPPHPILRENETTKQTKTPFYIKKRKL